jgi:pimeloyl-ACP methyl ester carboxylesterase
VRRRTATTLAVAAVVAAAVARHRTAMPAHEHLPARPEPPRGRESVVRTEDGVDLHVEEHGPDDATAVLVLAHGYTQASRLWGGTVRDLLAARPDLRVVVYDHRGHGRSGRTTQEAATLEQLGRDLATVIEAVTRGRDGLPVVVAGHSMGGMTVMAMAEQHPELVEDTLAGVAFVGTSSGGLDAVRWGLPAPLVPVFKAALPRLNALAYRLETRGRSRVQVGWFESFVNFAAGADPSDVQDVLAVQRECSAETMHFFLATFSEHDREQALENLAHLPGLVVVGEADRLCPVEHSRRIAAALPQAELVLFPGAGHMVHLERRPEVSRHLAALVDRAVRAHRAPAPVPA